MILILVPRDLESFDKQKTKKINYEYSLDIKGVLLLNIAVNWFRCISFSINDVKSYDPRM